MRRAHARFAEIYRDGQDAWTRVRLYPETVAALEQALALRPELVDRPALDLGCGRGRMLRELERQGVQRRVGLDLAAEALGDARPLAPWGVAAGDGVALPFRGGTFGLVTELTLLSSIEPALWPAAALEIARVVSPGGFYVTEQVQRPRGHPIEEPVDTACKLPRTLDRVWGFRPEDFDPLLGEDFDCRWLVEVPVRDPATDTPSWVGLFQKR